MTALIGIFVAGSLAFWLGDYYFPPVEQTKLLFGALAVWFVGGAILSWARKNDDGKDTNSYLPKKRYFVIAFMPLLTCATFVANAVLDSSTGLAHMTTVASRSKGRYWSSASVLSWKSEDKTIDIPVSPGCYNLLVHGRTVTVIEKDGALGMHWIAGISNCSR